MRCIWELQWLTLHWEHPAIPAYLWPCCHRIGIVLRNGAYLLPAALLWWILSLKHHANRITCIVIKMAHTQPQNSLTGIVCLIQPAPYSFLPNSHFICIFDWCALVLLYFLISFSLVLFFFFGTYSVRPPRISNLSGICLFLKLLMVLLWVLWASWTCSWAVWLFTLHWHKHSPKHYPFCRFSFSVIVLAWQLRFILDVFVGGRLNNKLPEG